jgi:hypothetical protein
MRFMILVKANQESETGQLPSQEMLTAMGKFNEELVTAGVLLAGEGLQPSAKGKRIHFAGAQRIIADGPFPEPPQLIAGFWLWQCGSMDEAVERAKRAPFHEGEVEIRQVFDADDFGAALTPELRAQEERIRVRVEQAAKTKQP